MAKYEKKSSDDAVRSRLAMLGVLIGFLCGPGFAVSLFVEVPSFVAACLLILLVLGATLVVVGSVLESRSRGVSAWRVARGSASSFFRFIFDFSV
ncbi:hypothetical protein [Myceligenerans halotolerans]